MRIKRSLLGRAYNEEKYTDCQNDYTEENKQSSVSAQGVAACGGEVHGYGAHDDED